MVMMARAYESIYDIFADPSMFEILMDPIKYNKLIRSLPQAQDRYKKHVSSINQSQIHI